MELEMEKSKIQMLYDLCNNVFTQAELPSLQQIQLLQNILDTFEAADVGIDDSILPGSPTSTPEGNKKGLICGLGVTEITYVHIHECDNFSMGVFCFPAGRTFPLHDHPGMTVMSKLLYGSVYVKSYDWVKVDCTKHPIIGVAGKVVDRIYSAPSEPWVLFPRSGGNIHSFTALTPCAILDVLTPPYSDQHGRPSTYFSEFHFPSVPSYAVLEEQELPSDLVVMGTKYLGPSIVTGDDLC